MPRKKDGMMFDVFPRPTKGENGQPLLYVRPASRIKWSMRSLDEFCNSYRGMSKGELTRAFTTFMDVASYKMYDGSRLETPIGSFAPKLKLDGDYTDPSQIHNKNVSFAGIEFIPSKQFLEAVKEQITRGFCRYIDVARRERVTDSAELDKILHGCMAGGYTTVKQFMYRSGMKYSTAKNWLLAHCEGESPLLRRTREGRTLLFMYASPDEPQET